MRQATESSIAQVSIKKAYNDRSEEIQDWIAIEAPLEIRLKKEGDLMAKPVSVTMRTPGHDELLALGFLFTEGILFDYRSVISVDTVDENVVEVLVSSDTETELGNADRNFYTTSSCGVCGKASIDAINVKSRFQLDPVSPTIDKQQIFGLQQKLIVQQSSFVKTGGIHASALFSSTGELIALKEDVGRHNAMDKLVGECWQKGLLPLTDKVLLLSGRASFELIQKATMAGISTIVSVGAPSSLAIELAAENRHTLVGFLKEDRFNIYTGAARVTE